MTAPLLKVEGLTVSFPVASARGNARAKVVDALSFEMAPGEALGIVGESGSGKSVTALALGRLLDPAARIERGRIRFDGRELLELPEDDLRRLRGRELAMIFQDPMTSLNPLYSVGFQVAEVLMEHFGCSRKEAMARAVEELRRVGIPSPEERYRDYPHRLSGGMQQRVMIAMAMAGRPKLLIADEPTTALDVTVQAEVLRLLARLMREQGMALLLISHDLSVIATLADRVLVMYAGEMVEEGSLASVFERPRHPYTRRLFASIPALDRRRDELRPIEGSMPSPVELATIGGCHFHPRCPERIDRCRNEAPPLDRRDRHSVRCWLEDPPGSGS